MADVLTCERCGGEISNEALVTGQCTYCTAALKLPRRPDKNKSARIISKAGEEMVVRIDEGDGIEVQRMEGIVWDPHSDPNESPAEKALAEAKAETEKQSGRVQLALIAFFVVVFGLVGVAMLLGR